MHATWQQRCSALRRQLRRHSAHWPGCCTLPANVPRYAALRYSIYRTKFLIDGPGVGQANRSTVVCRQRANKHAAATKTKQVWAGKTWKGGGSGAAAAPSKHYLTGRRGRLQMSKCWGSWAGCIQTAAQNGGSVQGGVAQEEQAQEGSRQARPAHRRRRQGWRACQFIRLRP